ncbi:MAG: sigma-54 interaction domain-containing protein [Bradymonadaceae bacterium]
METLDWSRLAARPEIRRLGAEIRDALGLWVGFAADGRAFPIGAAGNEVELPVCQRVKPNVLEDRDGGATSCEETIEAWSRAELDGAERVRCHAGYSAVLCPIRRGGAQLGSVYVSGFVEDARSEAQVDELRDRLARGDREERFESLDLDQGAVLDAADQRFAVATARAIAGCAERAVDEDGGDLELSGDDPRFEGMVGRAPSMQRLFDQIATVASSDSTVLIRGENGTGKELVARALHRRSSRSDRRVVALNCSALPPQLVESELFGHREGAFSGAHRDRLGLCDEADGGTLLLDEIGDMHPSLQSKLLRFLQDGCFTPVGANRQRSVDVRVVCATHRDLEQMVEQGDFRRDLFFRIRVVQLEVPPLRARRGDIPLLVDHFLSRAAREHGRQVPELSDEARRALVAHDWPGNVRELKNEVERLVVTGEGGRRIDTDELSPRLGGEPEVDVFPAVDDLTIPEATERLERKMILDGLRETGWNKTRAAENLGISRRSLIRKVSDYDLEEYREDE